ncbi:haloacid dehalogenase-like hydrolase domain-containing 5 isoform X4 [Phyllopteryx taeniolatus]|uniref:haloacid dehalogenase-like hydrolase domain-containing 5 isoform X4 n=1 Tax=Phyllopteryx taeniolatus TaxID=161469 RepID=UPI002AD2A9D8|nr:haloacid dehalogenase-like hydrolase domain-containing 5 isoform X4 [Phyllopteryx taeniolatus]
MRLFCACFVRFPCCDRSVRACVRACADQSGSGGFVVQPSADVVELPRQARAGVGPGTRLGHRPLFGLQEGGERGEALRTAPPAGHGRPQQETPTARRFAFQSELQPESAQIEGKSRRSRKTSTPITCGVLAAVVLFGEPVRWETNLQLLLDVLLTDGRPSRAYRPPAVQLPVLACNLDLLWMARAPSPRLGHGMFLLCLESAYKKLTGAELRYEALLGKPGLLTYRYARRALTRSNRHREVQTIYAIGDNPMTDVYGANLYDRYLARQHKRARPATGSQAGAAEPDEEEPAPPAARCRSVLVCTGVYGRPSASAPAPESVFLHGHRDMTAEAGLAEPSYVVDDVEAAVDLVLRRHL